MKACRPIWSCSTDNQRHVWAWEAAGLMKHVGGMVTNADWNPMTWGNLLRPAYAPPRMTCGSRGGTVTKSATAHDPAGGGAVKVSVTFTPLIGGEPRQIKMPQPPGKTWDNLNQCWVTDPAQPQSATASSGSQARP